MLDIFSKIGEAKEKVAETKARLNTVYVQGDVASGKVKVIMSGNRVVKEIRLADELMKADKEELEDLLVIATNKAIEQADKLNEAEMKAAAQGVLPNIPGLDGMF